MLGRTSSLKRQGDQVMAKTNEALTGFWKFATKAANASYKVTVNVSVYTSFCFLWFLDSLFFLS
jgi:hypothetical protein